MSILTKVVKILKILKITFWSISGLAFLIALIHVSFPSPDKYNAFKFTVPDQLGQATVGYKYNYSFCQPETARKEFCDSSASIPADGKAPYRFYEDTNPNFPLPLPKGLHLNVNGLLEGVPKTEGEIWFSICAVDSKEDRVCKIVPLNIVKR